MITLTPSFVNVSLYLKKKPLSLNLAFISLSFIKTKKAKIPLFKNIKAKSNKKYCIKTNHLGKSKRFHLLFFYPQVNPQVNSLNLKPFFLVLLKLLTQVHFTYFLTSLVYVCMYMCLVLFAFCLVLSFQLDLT